MRYKFLIVLITLSIFSNSAKENNTLILATTTSTRDSGLLDYILDDFTGQTHIDVKVIAVGTGKALQMGRDGEADVLLVHDLPSEKEFIQAGYGTKRFNVMFNDFIIVGPSSDPSNLNKKHPNSVIDGFKTIHKNRSKFVSRGDDSGTNKKEISLWKEAGFDIDPDLDCEKFYISVGKGMGDVLIMSSEMKAYTITDRATFLNMKNILELKILIENDKRLFNQYGVIPVNPDINRYINHDGAIQFVEWLLSDKIQKTIGEYGVEKFGMPLFTPNAE